MDTVVDEFVQVTLEHELLDHLAHEESIWKLWPHFTEEYLLDDEPIGRSVLEYQWDHMRSYGEPASKDALGYAFPDIEFVVPTTNIEWLVDEFKTRYISNRAKSTALKVAKLISRDPTGAVDVALHEFGILKDVSRQVSISVETGDYKKILDDYFNQNVQESISFGFEAIDKKLIGMLKGRMYAVIGRPKKHKSWMLLASAIACQESGKRAIIFELEMPKEEMFWRYACLATSISWNRFVHQQLTSQEKKELYDALAWLSDNQCPLSIVQPPMGERKVSDLKALAKDKNADCVYVDQISFIKSRRSYGDRRNLEIEEICEEVKADAVQDVPWFIACQFSREAANLTEMADLSKIGLSDAIGQKSDLLLGLHQSKEMRDSNSFQYGVLDARSFGTTVWEMAYDLSSTTAYKIVGETE